MLELLGFPRAFIEEFLRSFPLIGGQSVVGPVDQRWLGPIVEARPTERASCKRAASCSIDYSYTLIDGHLFFVYE